MKNLETAKRLVLALERKGIKAQELADRSGVNKVSISQYVNGTHAPSNLSAGKMAAVLGVSPVWLMGFDVPMVDAPSGVSRTLSSDAVELLDDYSKLNEAGRQEVRKYTRILSGNDEYTEKGTGSEGSVSA